MVYRASFVTGYVVVALLLVFAAQWRRLVETRLPGSTAAHVVPLGIAASAAGLTYGYGWKGALGNYMPGGMEEGLYDTQGLYVYYVLTDFGAFIGWLGVVVAAGAVAWMGLRERTVARWLGAFSVLPVVALVAGSGIGGVAGFPALVAPIWLVVLGLGLAFGKHTATRLTGRRLGNERGLQIGFELHREYRGLRHHRLPSVMTTYIPSPRAYDDPG